MYTVIKAFTYGGLDYAYGDPWEPSGHKNDAAIIRARKVIDRAVDPQVQRATAEASAPTRARARARKVPA